MVIRYSETCHSSERSMFSQEMVDQLWKIINLLFSLNHVYHELMGAAV